MMLLCILLHTNKYVFIQSTWRQPDVAMQPAARFAGTTNRVGAALSIVKETGKLDAMQQAHCKDISVHPVRHIQDPASN